MTRSPDHSRERSCRGKARHRTHYHARVALRRSIEQMGDMTLTTFSCEWCGGWHVGHPLVGEQRRLHFTRLVALIDKANAPEHAAAGGGR